MYVQQEVQDSLFASMLKQYEEEHPEEVASLNEWVRTLQVINSQIPAEPLVVYLPLVVAY